MSNFAAVLLSQEKRAGIFAFMAKLAGLKNIDSFQKAPAQAAATPIDVKPDSTIQSEAQAGNIVPLSEV